MLGGPQRELLHQLDVFFRSFDFGQVFEERAVVANCSSGMVDRECKTDGESVC